MNPSTTAALSKAARKLVSNVRMCIESYFANEHELQVKAKEFLNESKGRRYNALAAIEQPTPNQSPAAACDDIEKE